MPSDLLSTLEKLRRGQSSAATEIEHAIAAAQSPCGAHVFIQPMFEEARASAAATDPARHPLAGLAVSVKDLFDIAGQTTRAGSIALNDAPPAIADAPTVARLRAAGGTIIGRTNMTEFAFSGVGINPHFGTPANAATSDCPRVPGGSSSGAAVSVAIGAAHIGLGSDTGGSIRIPAALNGIVGFKNTARLVPCEGTIPLSFTLDTACAMTRTVRDAILAHEILAARRVSLSQAPMASYRLAVASSVMLDSLDPVVARAWERTLHTLRQAGARIEEITLPELDELPAMQSSGGISPAESYAWHRALLQTRAAQYDPRVLARIERGAGMSAADYITLMQARRAWIGRVERALAGFDAVLSPTVPRVAPPIAEVAPGPARDEAFFKLNGLLLRNPSVVNMLDGCAISIPCHTPDELPVGLMIWHGALHDDAILSIALQIEQQLTH
jgi:Asp-tRNA(Asn)/Glu-tRNA(Gln) amidotransferase A subunit family amidase